MASNTSTDAIHVREEGRGRSLADYAPLGALVLVALAAALAIAAGGRGLAMAPVMHAYMGIFLCIFALLKLFDLPGFADGFEMYDLAAKRWRAWGFVYPFLELGLGLAYLAHFAPLATYAVTIGLFCFGAVGVVQALREGIDIECPCMGTVLSVPLSTVTLAEDGAMGVMAAALLAMAV